MAELFCRYKRILMETQVRPKYYVMHDGFPVPLVSLRTRVDSVTHALLGKEELTKEELRRWQGLNYPITMVNFEAHDVKVSGDFMGKDQGGRVPLLFRLTEKWKNLTSNTYYSTEAEMRAGFKAIASHFNKFPSDSQESKDRYKQEEVDLDWIEKFNKHFKEHREWKAEPNKDPYQGLVKKWKKDIGF